LRVSFSPYYSPEISPLHPFPMRKYAAVHRRLVDEGSLSAERVLDPGPARLRDLARVHCPLYLRRFLQDGLDRDEERRLGFSWTPALARRASYATAGTLSATRMALEHGLGANLAGGSHHAFRAHGEGYCALNDIAITVASLRAAGMDQRIAVIDLDVHQGNGTASLLGQDPSVYTLSLHGEQNYPRVKVPGTRDVGLPNGTTDAAYLDCLDEELDRLWEPFQPEIVLYQAGVDPYFDDRLGGLALTREGLWRRTERVLTRCRGSGIPVAILMGGGYARRFEDTVELHADVYRCASGFFRFLGTPYR
jgi:acetoin utilization deacetylase AcuC-like enzyme